MSEHGTMEEYKEVAGGGGRAGESEKSKGNDVTVLRPLIAAAHPSSTTAPTIHPTQPSQSAAAPSSDAAKVKQLQSMMQQARDGYQALNQRYSTLQSECRQLMKKEEESASTIQRLTAQVHRLSAAAAVAVTDASGLTAMSGPEADEEKSEFDLGKSRRGSEVDIAAQLREQAMVDRMQQLQFDLNNQRKEADDWKQKCKDAQQQLAALKQQQQPQRAEQEIDALRHQLQQLTLDAAAIDSLALDLSVSQKERERAERERNVLKDEVQRLIGKLEEERDEREREQAVQQHKQLTLRQKAEESDVLATQNAHLAEELSLLTASITQLRDQLVATQRDNRTLREEADRVRTERVEAESKLRRYAADMEGGQLVDRRLVVKMLTTYYERGQAQDVLDIMFKLLQFTDDERKRVTDSRRGRGWVGSVASILNPFDSERDSVVQERDDASVADLWVEFLLKETAKEEGAPSATTKPSRTIYEAIASPTATTGRPAPARFSTPQPQRSNIATNAPQAFTFSSISTTSTSQSSAPVSQPQPLPSPPSQLSFAHPVASSLPHTAASLPVPSAHFTPSRPPVPLKATPITLPPHIRPAFPLPGRPLAAPPPSATHPQPFSSSTPPALLPLHPVFAVGLPLPRAVVPGQPVPVVRPASPIPPLSQQ